MAVDCSVTLRWKVRPVVPFACVLLSPLFSHDTEDQLLVAIGCSDGKVRVFRIDSSQVNRMSSRDMLHLERRWLLKRLIDHSGAVLVGDERWCGALPYISGVDATSQQWS